MAKAGSYCCVVLACLFIVKLTAGPITVNVAPLTAPESFQIMTPAESAEHRAKMAKLTGEARERYRNEQYAKLRQRAQAQGYELPETPPWGRTDLLPPVALPAHDGQPAAVRQQVDNRRSEIRQDLISEAIDFAEMPTDDKVAKPKGKTAESNPSEDEAAMTKPVFRTATQSEAQTDSRRGATFNQSSPREGAVAGPGHFARVPAAKTTEAHLDHPADTGQPSAPYIARRREAIQERIDRAIEAMEQPPSLAPVYPMPRRPFGYPPMQPPNFPPISPAPSVWPRAGVGQTAR